jgi:hypothetical protein
MNMWPSLPPNLKHSKQILGVCGGHLNSVISSGIWKNQIQRTVAGSGYFKNFEELLLGLMKEGIGITPGSFLSSCLAF